MESKLDKLEEENQSMESTLDFDWIPSTDSPPFDQIKVDLESTHEEGHSRPPPRRRSRCEEGPHK